MGIDPYLLGQSWLFQPPAMFEPVTLKIRQPATASSSDVFFSYTVFRAQRKIIQQSAPTSGGKILSVDTLDWLIFQEAIDDAQAIPPATLPCGIPDKDDQLTDKNGITYTITKVSREIDGNAHVLSTKANV